MTPTLFDEYLNIIEYNDDLTDYINEGANTCLARVQHVLP